MTKEVSEPKPKLWKDYLGLKQVDAFGEAVTAVYPKFDLSTFLARIKKADCYTKELKERISIIADTLFPLLPSKYAQAVKTLIKIAPTVGTFENWILTACVERHGLDHFDGSVQAMKELTKYGTCEFAIRPYLLNYEKEMLPILHTWAMDKNEHVRRLAAEGTRPRGVWMRRIASFIDDPTEVLKILERLKTDPSLYVRKAVANNLNDISKDHPEVVLETALRWQKDKQPHSDWIIKRGCRTLIKKGDPRVFSIFGFANNPKIAIEITKVTPKRVTIGGAVKVDITLTSRAKKAQKLAVDYRIHYIKKNGGNSPKVFKLSECVLKPNEILTLSIKQSMAEMSTRTHYQGKHSVEIVANGHVYAETSFVLVR